MLKRLGVLLTVGIAVLLFIMLPGLKQKGSAQSTNPPPGYTVYIPVCYDDTNGAARFVKTWGASQGDPNCTPPSPWAIINGSYDGVACTSGGSFDCRKNEFYTEIQQH
jgi:hypothetical protein